MEEEPAEKKTLEFVNPEKGARHYVARYVGEPKYRDWFHRNYPDHEFHDAIGISKEKFGELADGLAEYPDPPGQQEADAGGATATERGGGDNGGSGGLAGLRRLAGRIRREKNPEKKKEEKKGEEKKGEEKKGEEKKGEEKKGEEKKGEEKKGEEKKGEEKKGEEKKGEEKKGEEKKGEEKKGEEKKGEEKAQPGVKADSRPSGEDLAKSVFESQVSDGEGTTYDRRTFEEFVDERILVSRDLFSKKEMKIKILEVSDEIQESKIRWKFGDRVKVNKILVTIKHLDSMEVEEAEFDIEAIEKELSEKRHWSSTNRWVPSTDIKNGYVVNAKHTALISDAVALDYIVF